MAKRRAIVTGATGFIGSHLVAHLARTGWEVHALVRPSSDVRGLKVMESQIVIHRLPKEAPEVSSLLRDVGASTCWHLAALYRSEHATTDVEHLVEANVGLGTRLLEALVQAGTTTIVSVGTLLQERGPDGGPVSLYAACKQAFETILSYYVTAQGLAGVAVRLPDTYGPRDPRTKIVSLLMEAARSGDPLPMTEGEQYIDLLHVDDVVTGLLRAADVARAGSLLVRSLSSGGPITLRALVQEVSQSIGHEVPVRWGARAYLGSEIMSPQSPSSILEGWVPGISRRAAFAEIWSEKV